MKQDLAQARRALTGDGWLSRQPASFQDEVLEGGVLLRYERGQTVFSVGDPPGGVHGLVEGRLSVSVASGATGPHLASIVMPGAWLGEGCFLTGAPRRVTLEAEAPSLLLRLPLAEMERLAALDAVNVRRFGQIAMLNAFDALHAVEDLLIPQAERRLAAVLWRNAGGVAGRRIPISQERLGRMANVSRKSVLALLRRFAGIGAIAHGYGRIDVLDADALRRIADGPEG